MKLKKFFCTLSGDDFNIITKCETRLQLRFLGIGITVGLIFVLCFVSSYFTFTKLFKTTIIGIPMSILFAAMITNIYLLLLYTLSKRSFPCSSSDLANKFSIVLRIIFICLIATIVSKPIEQLIFNDIVVQEIAIYKQQKLNLYVKSTTAFFNGEIQEIKKIIHNQKVLNYSFNKTYISHYQKLIQAKIAKKVELVNSMHKLVNNSNYYIQGIKILNTKYPYSWLITMMTIILFLTPAILKYRLGESSTFYDTKRNIENRLVMEEYSEFKENYSKLLSKWSIKPLHFRECYIDPPLNTIRKGDTRSFKKEETLITTIYNE